MPHQEKEVVLMSQCNEKLRNKILLVSMKLNINKKCGTIDGANDEEILQIVLGEIKIMLNSISNALEERCSR